MPEQTNPALVAIRTQKGLAQKLADKLQIKRTAVYMWKKRVPPIHALKVARALRMPVHLVCPEMFSVPHRTAKRPARASRSVKEN